MNNDIMEATNRIAFKTKQGKISIDATKIEDSYYLLVNSKDNTQITGIELDSPYLLLFLDKIILEGDNITVLASGRENVKLESIYKVEDDMLYKTNRLVIPEPEEGVKEINLAFYLTDIIDIKADMDLISYLAKNSYLYGDNKLLTKYEIYVPIFEVIEGYKDGNDDKNKVMNKTKFKVINGGLRNTKKQ